MKSNFIFFLLQYSYTTPFTVQNASIEYHDDVYKELFCSFNSLHLFGRVSPKADYAAREEMPATPLTLYPLQVHPPTPQPVTGCLTEITL